MSLQLTEGDLVALIEEKNRLVRENWELRRLLDEALAEINRVAPYLAARGVLGYRLEFKGAEGES